jgi:3-oxoacyl-[acyl-carrier protein] reductase
VSSVDLTGRTIVVTGAGIGRGLAVAAGKAGARVVVGARHDDGIETAELAGPDAVFVRSDVTVPEDVEALFAAAGTVHGVIHNATSRLSNVPAKLAEVTPEEWREHESVSLTGAYLLARAALPRLAERDGRFVVMTSPAGMEGSPMNPFYGVVKGGLRGFAKSLAREWAPLGHTVTAVSPLAQTEALTKAFVNDPTLQGRLTAKVPLGWFGDPERDIAPPVLFLVSAGARYVTGQTLVVDGGRFTNL